MTDAVSKENISPLSLTLPVLNDKGEETGRTCTLPESFFGIQPHEHALYLAVVHYRARQRQGNAKTKDKSDIAFSTRKLFRQKGTGRARRGSRKAGILRKGARVFGPQPRDYGGKLNQKVKLLAKRSALSLKAQKKQIVIIEDIDFPKPATKVYYALLKKLNAEKAKVLWLTTQIATNLIRSSNNIPRNQVVRFSHLNVYDLMNSTRVFIFESALSTLLS